MVDWIIVPICHAFLVLELHTKGPCPVILKFLPLKWNILPFPTDVGLNNLACFGQWNMGGNVSVCILAQCFKPLPLIWKEHFLGSCWSKEDKRTVELMADLYPRFWNPKIRSQSLKSTLARPRGSHLQTWEWEIPACCFKPLDFWSGLLYSIIEAVAD